MPEDFTKLGDKAGFRLYTTTSISFAKPVGPKSVGGMISFAFTMTPGISPSSGTVKVSWDFIKKTWGIDPYDAKSVLRKLVNFSVEVYDGVHSQTIKYLTASKISYDKPKKLEGKTVTITFVDCRYLLKYGGVFGSYNWTVGENVEGSWFDQLTTKPNGDPYTYQEVVDDKIIGSDKWPLPGKYVKGMSFKTRPSEEISSFKIFATPVSLSTIKYIPLNIEWTGQSPANVLSDLLSKTGLQLHLMPDGDYFLARPKKHYGIPDIKWQGILKYGAGMEGPDVPSKIIVIGSPKRDQIVVAPSVIVKEIKTTTEGYQTAEGKVISKTDWAKGGATSKSGTASLIEFETISKQYEATPGLIAVAVDWPDGKIKPIEVVAKNWDVDLKEIRKSVLAHHRTSVWLNLIKSATGKSLNDLQADLDRLHDQLDRHGEGDDPDDLLKLKQKLLEYKHLMFEAEAKMALADKCFYRWYRLPEFIEVKYDAKAMAAREQYMKDNPDFAKITAGAKSSNTGKPEKLLDVTGVAGPPSNMKIPGT